MKIRTDCSQQRVRSLCADLIAFRRGKALGDEILGQLGAGQISHQACTRLGRWCHSARTEAVQPIARGPLERAVWPNCPES